jgi:hypothetical protein
MENKFKDEKFAILDLSKQALANCTCAKMLQDPFMSLSDLQKRFTRFTIPSHEHDPYGNTDLKSLYPVLRSSNRLAGSTGPELESQHKPPVATGLEHITGGARPRLDAILRTVDVYAQWAFGIEAKTIFQALLGPGKNDPGDNGRLEIKLNKLPEVLERLEGEDDANFYDRHAGRAWLIVDAHNKHVSLFQVFKLTDVDYSFDSSMASLLFGDARKNTVQRQGPHADKRPEDKVRAIAALNSVSAAKDNKANVGIIRNSASNIQKLLILRRFFPKFREIFIRINSKSQKLTADEIDIGWDLVCKLFIDENRNEFKSMSAVELHLLPFEYLVFDTDLVHWGGNYCRSGHLNIRYSKATVYDPQIL